MRYYFLEAKKRYRSFGIDVNDPKYVFNLWMTFIPVFLFRKNIVLVTTLSHNMYLNFLVKLANRVGITTVLVVDGIFEYNNSFNNPFLKYFSGCLYRPNFHDYILLQSDEIGCEMVERGGGQVVSVKNMRVWDGQQVEAASNRKVKALITTANTPYFNDAEYEILLAMILNIKAWMIKNNVDFEFRIFDERLVSDLDLNEAENATSAEFSLVINSYSHVVCTPSSLGLNIMARGLSLMQMVYRDTPLPFQSGWLIAPGFDFDSVMSSFFESNPERINYQYSVVKSFSGTAINDALSSVSAVNKPKHGSVVFSYFSLVASEVEFLSKFKAFVKKILKSRG